MLTVKSLERFTILFSNKLVVIGIQSSNARSACNEPPVYPILLCQVINKGGIRFELAGHALVKVNRKEIAML